MKKKVCIDCGNEISFYATRCLSCGKKGNTNGFQKGEHPPGEWKKGNKPWNTGKKWSKEYVEKITAPQRGKHYSLDTEFKKGEAPWNKGKEGFKFDKHRGYGCHKISFKHPGCVWHHVNMMFTVACPENVHNKCAHHVLGSYGIHAHFLEGVLG